ncbi:MAG: peptidoglycan-binding protein [Alphaproteobacteria bacterium]|nr:peptidoglycan-binding protein [Alphaproteobacteria bacterium]
MVARFLQAPATGALLFLLVLVALPAAAAAADAEPAAIAARLGAAEVAIPGAKRLALERLRAFYAGRDHRPVWSGSGEGRADAAAALAVLAAADRHGLDPARYHAAAIATRSDAIEAELLLSDGLMRYFADMGSGRIDPSRLGPEDYAKPAPTDGAAALGAALQGGLQAALARAAPAAPDYGRLLQALAAARALADAGPWPTLDDGQKLRPGDAGSRAQQLCRRLRASSETRQACDQITSYTEALARDVRAFQARHGLAPDGVVGEATRARLNLQPGDLAEIIALNLERWRWLPWDLGRRHVLVDMAAFDLRLMEDGREVMAMPIVVGRAYFHTPIFSSAITHLVLNPTWHVPPRIAREVLLPRIKEDPDYLGANGFRVFAAAPEGRREVDAAAVDWERLGIRHFPYVLRQQPGPKNALGRIKFELPNPFVVYLHDTPDHSLFRQRVRAFSSGCIRLARAADLALYLLQGREPWSATTLAEAIAAGHTRTIALPAPLPVHLVYFTAFVDAAGALRFHDDIYGRDQKLRAALVRVN